MMAEVKVSINKHTIERLLRENGQYLITVHNGHITKAQRVEKPGELVDVEEDKPASKPRTRKNATE